ncbi:MAG: SpaH/EbpB family LPXTG-anchored major pilin [Oscillospiraceae bacterium]|nr:SpaH/EbpB family LPXTG-anchored major pilin [Oscillospiraceae bacterium]
MKRAIKKSLLLVMAVVMVLGLVTTGALAAPDLTGRDPNAAVSLTIHYNIMPDGTPIAGTPVGPPSLPNPQGAPISNASWSIQRISVPDGANWNGAANTVQDSWLVGTVYTDVTDTNGRVTFTPAVQGVYLVTGPADATPQRFVVSLPMLFENEWLYDVHVFAKQVTNPVFDKELLTVTKQTGANAAALGYALATWEFTLDIRAGLEILPAVPNTDGAVFIRVVDVLDSRLVLVPGTVVVSFDTDGTGNNQTTLTHGTDWVLNSTGNTHTIDILGPGRNAIAANGHVGGRIRIELQTSVIDLERDEDDLGRIANTGTLHYGSRDPFGLFGTPETHPSFTVFALEVLKTSNSGAILPGAVFRLYRAADVTGGTINSGAIPIAIMNSDTDQHWFYGLLSGDYYLYEVEAPTGYNRITTPMRVTVTAATTDADYILTVTVVNNRNFELPLTGGAGTLLFTAIGLALIGGSILFLLVLFKKKKKEDNEAA